MTTAIVILNWNGQEYLKRFLPFLIEHTTLIGAEIIVADNASTDGSVEMLANQFPTVRTLVLDKNYGFAGGYNKALAQIEADYYVLLNSDVEVAAGWLEPMINYLEANKDVAACQPKVRAYNQRTHFEHAGAAGGFIDRYGFPFCRGRIFGKVEEDKGQYDTIVDVFWATGACLVIRADLYRKAGGLDDEFFAHMEEIDLCWRLKSRGFRLVCVPESVVYHIGGGTLDAENPRKVYLNFRNNLFLLYKNLPNTQLKSVMCRRRIFDYVAVLQFIASGKIEHAKSVIRARKDYKAMRSSFIDKRKANILYSTCVDHPEMLQKSIVLQYFFRAKHTYSEMVAK